MLLSNILIHRNFIQNLDGNWGLLSDSLRSLDLSDNSINEIRSVQNNVERHDLSNLRKLVKLDLSTNFLRDINSNNLPENLVTIDLSKNVLSFIPKPVQNLHNLRVLHLSDNLLTNLNNISFQGTLEKIDLSQNLILSLTNNLFAVKAINLNNNLISFLPPYAFNKTNLKHLVLSNNFIEKVHDDAFSTLENSLEYLDLEGNFLFQIPDAIKKMKNLQYLYLSSNAIKKLDIILPSTLKVLSLSTNELNSIPNNIFINCTELSYLNMGYNLINFANSTFLNSCRKLQTLLLRNNKIEILNCDSFTGLTSLKELSLSFNNIHYVHPFTFKNISKTLKILEMSFSSSNEDLKINDILNHLTTLNILVLDNNNIKTITNRTLMFLHEVEFIDLSFNRITFIPSDLLQSHIHTNLLEIDLSHNLIEKIYSKTFYKLDALHTINLSSNKIGCIENSSFRYLRNINHIDLSYNRLKTLKDSLFEHLPNLKIIDFRFNALISFALKIFRHVSNISMPMSINISNNFVNNFDDELSTYLYIYSLDVSHNQLKDTQSFKNVGYSLRILYLNSNRIAILDNHAFGDLPVLEILNLSSNNISILRKRSFQGLSNLQELDLSHNLIQNLQIGHFSNLLRIRILRLNNNLMKALPRDVFLNTRLEFIDLSNNFLSIWPISSFSDVGFTIRSIHMSNNLLEYLDANMYVNTQYLTELNLSQNKIKVLPNNTFKTLSNLAFLDMSQNLLVDANFQEILNEMKNLKILKLKSAMILNITIMCLNNLMEIDLSGNLFKDAGLNLKEVKNLRKLKVSENYIINFTKFVQNLPTNSIKHLDISNNPIEEFKVQDFMPIKYLEILKMDKINLKKNEVDFRHLKNLKILKINIEQCGIATQLKSLRRIHLFVNDFKINEKYLMKLQNLKLNHIEITGSKLKSIGFNSFHSFKQIKNLKIVIRETSIKDLPASLFDLGLIPKLFIELINNTLLQRINSNVFYPNASNWSKFGTRNFIGGIVLRGQNEIVCNCDHEWYGVWLRRWLKEKSQIEKFSKLVYQNILQVIK